MTSATGRPVVVGYDGTSRGDDAIALGRVIADRLRAPIEVVCMHRYTPLPSHVDGDGWGSVTAAGASSALERARAQLAGRSGATFRRLPASTPVLGLDLAAEEVDAEIVVVGSTGTAEQLVAHARRPVAVAPDGYAARRSSPALVGIAYDGGHDSRAAVTFARRLRNGCSTRLRLIGVFDPAACDRDGTDRSYGLPATLDDARDRAFERLGSAAAQLPDGEAQFLEGWPAATLTEASRHVDLMVTGSHGRGARAGAPLGSVSTELVAHAACPVLIVPRSA